MHVVKFVAWPAGPQSYWLSATDSNALTDNCIRIAQVQLPPSHLLLPGCVLGARLANLTGHGPGGVVNATACQYRVRNWLLYSGFKGNRSILWVFVTECMSNMLDICHNQYIRLTLKAQQYFYTLNQEKKGLLLIWNHHKCLSWLFLFHLNTYCMGRRPLWLF